MISQWIWRFWGFHIFRQTWISLVPPNTDRSSISHIHWVRRWFFGGRPWRRHWGWKHFARREPARPALRMRDGHPSTLPAATVMPLDEGPAGQRWRTSRPFTTVGPRFEPRSLFLLRSHPIFLETNNFFTPMTQSFKRETLGLILPLPYPSLLLDLQRVREHLSISSIPSRPNLTSLNAKSLTTAFRHLPTLRFLRRPSWTFCWPSFSWTPRSPSRPVGPPRTSRPGRSTTRCSRCSTRAAPVRWGSWRRPGSPWRTSWGSCDLAHRKNRENLVNFQEKV